eukprot:c7062_g1_i1.p2 GENE.c7062_g1_i1~~c7062_g1_i1.p2  ORF type:complete len:104 (-),score=1.94 c7062_g1_i1:117-404(-)
MTIRRVDTQPPFSHTKNLAYSIPYRICSPNIHLIQATNKDWRKAVGVRARKLVRERGRWYVIKSARPPFMRTYSFISITFNGFKVFVVVWELILG